MHHLLSIYFKHKIIMKKTLFLLVIAAMCCVSYLSAQNSVPKNYQKKTHPLLWKNGLTTNTSTKE